MKLSQLDSDRMLDVICELSPVIDEIVSDEEISRIIADRVKPKEEESEEAFRQRAFNKGISNVIKVATTIFKAHREAVYKILSTMNEKSVEEIRTQKGTATIKEFVEILKDEDLLKLFT